VVDLPEELRDLPGPIGRYFIDPLHPNPHGHRVIAAAIEKALRELWHEPPAAGRQRERTGLSDLATFLSIAGAAGTTTRSCRRVRAVA
jgi:hypothetical protein